MDKLPITCFIREPDVPLHTGKKMYEHACQVCQKRYSRKRNLDRHMLIHSKENPLKCETCGRRFLKEITLIRHRKRHKGKHSFECPTCGKRFKKKSKCPVCVHTEENPYESKVGLKPYKQNFNRHMRIHTDERSFVCEICGQRFTEKDHLRLHEMEHTGERPFECSFFGKRFIQTSDYSSHNCIHTEKKSYECKICSRRFSRKYSLKQHMQKHAQN
ncbi:zinc finger protein OZF-like [Agrilus planipennis]|uniref:Zinc finger protein 865 n=1 Tax=Agrilus planipennis TaxID=224129 RepID=A0A7F5RKL8_AGRPL|nr:zinc finger protein OZF-like [Agrilus planipennis]